MTGGKAAAITAAGGAVADLAVEANGGVMLVASQVGGGAPAGRPDATSSLDVWGTQLSAGAAG